MKNSAVRLIAALSTFTVGVALVALWLGYNDSGRTRRAQAPCQRRAQAEAPPPAAPGARSPAGQSLSPVLSYCELAWNSDRYDGKIVRVRASLRMSIHGLFLSDVTCDRYENYAAVHFHAARMQSLKRELSDGRGASLIGPSPVELIVIGRFEKVIPSRETDSLLDNVPLRFEIMHVEKMHAEKALTVEPQARKVTR